MDHKDIARIRGATFSESRRGYDKREVERFLSKLADWLESGAMEEAASYAVKAKLERAGEATARILTSAEEEAQLLRHEAAEEARRLVRETEERVRETLESADRKADRTVAEAEARRRAIEVVIADLVARRDEVLGELERLSDRLAAALDTHERPAVVEGVEPAAELPEARPSA